jgi:hypothetical protein
MTLQPEMIAGLILLLGGWAVIPLAIRMVGLLLGAALGVLIIDVFVLTVPDFFPSIWFYIVAGSIFGALGWFIAAKLFLVLVFACGIVGALALKLRLDETLEFSQRLAESGLGDFALTPWFTLLVAVVGGILLAFLKKYLIIVLTALAGTALIVEGTEFQNRSITIAIVGAAFQTLCASVLMGRKKRRAEAD